MTLRDLRFFAALPWALFLDLVDWADTKLCDAINGPEDEL